MVRCPRERLAFNTDLHVNTKIALERLLHVIGPGLAKIPGSAECMFWLAYVHKDECSCLPCLQGPQGRNNPNVYQQWSTSSAETIGANTV